ncbi:MAG TPA: thioredoxin family protein [Opitutaceae bacterium]|nr:thioredoxin family protein [Opitutaceae bacterium]
MKPLKLLLVLAALGAFAGAACAKVEVGQPAPGFTLTDIDGQTHSLSDYKGKIVVLEWNNPDCPIVHKHYESGNIPGLQKSAISDGVVWLMINSGAPGKEGADYTPDQIKAWLQKYSAAPTAYCYDHDGKVGHLYNAKTTPDMYVINADGILVYEGAIDSIRSADISDIAKATNYVKVALDAIKSGQPVPTPVSRPYGCSVKY